MYLRSVTFQTGSGTFIRFGLVSPLLLLFLPSTYLPPCLHISSSIFSALPPSYVYLLLNFLVVVSHHVRDKATTWRANIERLNEGGVRGQGAIQRHARIVELGEQGVVDPVFGDAGSLISVGGPSV